MEKRITPKKLQLSKKTVVRLRDAHNTKLAGGTGTNQTDQCQTKAETACHSDPRICQLTATFRNGATMLCKMTSL
jgi:hypothetical protein